MNGTSGTAATTAIFNQSQATTNNVAINNTHTSGTLTNSLLINNNGSGGTTTNLLNLTNTAGTVTNAINISGTVSNYLNTDTFDISSTGAITLSPPLAGGVTQDNQ